MKKILMALLCVLGLASCSMFDAVKYSEEISAGTQDDFDRYPGMNVSELPLTGNVFTWPAAIRMNGIITGQQNQSEDEDQDEVHRGNRRHQAPV